MRKIVEYVIAGVLGGLVVLGGFQLLQTPQEINTPKEPIGHRNFVSNSSPLPNDFRLAAKQSIKTVVHIKSSAAPKRTSSAQDPFSFFFGNGFNEFSQEGTGSGVIYSEDGFIITNNHVIDFADEVEVTLYDNRKYKATVIGTDEKMDLAVLKIEAEDLPAIRFGDSDRAQVGDWVLAVGNPFELTSTVTAGIVSAKGRTLPSDHGHKGIEAFIQTDAAVNPGNSGGALVNPQGELIGINTAIASPTGSYAGYSFAIPSNIVINVVKNLIKYGSPKRGKLGVLIADMDSDLSKELMIDIAQGAYVSEIVPGGAAQMAGLLPDDVIVEVNNQKIKNVPDLMAVIGESNVGDLLKITVNRHGKLKEIDVTLKG